MRNLSTPTQTVVIRPAEGIEDTVALRSLAELDSKKIADGPALVAEVDGEARAALFLADGRIVADPFHPTADLAALLQARANGGERRSSRLLSGLAAVATPAERKLRHAFAARS
jgi:hypothetical protein